jgi:hypothetical protein
LENASVMLENEAHGLLENHKTSFTYIYYNCVLWLSGMTRLSSATKKPLVVLAAVGDNRDINSQRAVEQMLRKKAPKSANV